MDEIVRCADGIQLDLGRYQVRSPDGVQASLTAQEAAFCRRLTAQLDQVVTAPALYAAVYGQTALNEGEAFRAARQIVAQLRAKRLPIETRWGIGYRLAV